MSNNNDLTSGGILKKLLVVAVPIMGTQLMQMAYNLTDLFWLGKLSYGTTAVAASGLGGMFLWLSQAFMMYGRMGSEIGVSQSLGRNDRGAAQHYAENSATLSLLLGIAFGLFMVVFAGPLVSIFGVLEADVTTHAISYIRITGIGIPFTFLSAAITGTFNGAGNSRLSFVANFLGLAFNMLLDPLLILVWDWGVSGAAIATILAQIIVCVVFMVLSRMRYTRIFDKFRFFSRMDREAIRQIGKWSTPIALESGAFTLLAMVVTNMNAQFGENAIAVQKIGNQIESLSWLIAGGFGSAVTAFVGQNYGAGQFKRIARGTRISLGIMLVWGAFISLLLYFFGAQLFRLFLDKAEVYQMGGEYLKLLALCQLPACLEGTCAGAFRGMGMTLPPSICSIISNVLRPPLAYLLISLGMGIHGVWLAIVVTAILRATSICVWYLIHAKRGLAEQPLA